MLAGGCMNMSPEARVDVTKVLTARPDEEAVFATINATYPASITYEPPDQVPIIGIQGLPPEVVAELIKAGFQVVSDVSTGYFNTRATMVTLDIELLAVGDNVASNAHGMVNTVIRMPIEADRPEHLYPECDETPQE